MFRFFILLSLVVLVSCSKHRPVAVAVPEAKIPLRWKVTMKGLRDVEAPDKAYIVVPFEETTRVDLYESVLEYFHRSYGRDIDKMLTGQVEGKYLRIERRVPNLFKLAGTFEGDYVMQILFKHGRVKVEVSDIILYNPKKPEKVARTEKDFGKLFFNKSGKVQRSRPKRSIEDHFNREIERLVKFVEDPQRRGW